MILYYIMSYHIRRWCTYKEIYIYTQTDRGTVQSESQNDMFVTSVYIYVHTDIRYCMSYDVVNVMYCVRYPVSHTHKCCVFACRSMCLGYCK